MISRRPIKIVTLTIVVSGNTGSATFNAIGHIQTVGFLANGFTFDYSVTDPAGVGILGSTGLSGNTTVIVDRPCQGTNTLTLSTASNGTYTVELYIEPGA